VDCLPLVLTVSRVIDGSINDVVARVPMGDSSVLALDSRTREAFVANVSSDFKSGEVDVIDITSRDVMRTVQRQHLFRGF